MPNRLQQVSTNQEECRCGRWRQADSPYHTYIRSCLRSHPLYMSARSHRCCSRMDSTLSTQTQSINQSVI